MPLDQTYRAVSDGTRRQIIDLLVSRGPLRAGDIAGNFPSISRPAVSKHLRILRESRLVRESKQGRERWYAFSAVPLSEVYQWVRRYEQFWSGKLEELARIVEEKKE